MKTVRSGRLNWTQAAWFNGPDDVKTEACNLSQTCSADGCTMSDFVAALRLLFARHEAMRTVYDRDTSGYFQQRVIESPADLSAVDGLITVTSPQDAAAVFQETKDRRFDLEGEFCVRFVVVEERSRLCEIGIVVDHAMFDGWGVRVLRDDLRQALKGVAFGSDDHVAQPLDLTVWENSGDGVRYHQRARRFWFNQLQKAEAVSPESIWNVDRCAAFGNYAATSNAMLHDVRAASRRWQVPRPAVVMAAFGDVMCELSDTTSISFFTKTVGRYSEAHRKAAGHMADQAPVVLDRSVGGGAVKAAEHARGQQLLAERYGRVDRHAIEGLLPSRFPRIPSLVLSGAASPNMVGALFNYVGFRGASQGYSSNWCGVHHLQPESSAPTQQHGIVRHSQDLKAGVNLLLNIWEEEDGMGLELIYRDCDPIRDAARLLLPRLREKIANFSDA
ncbi:condensation domain-containing protein [Streptomyces chartreusis]|uniref:condensation domain-containing protein n=1 Tax=Streptomyces chartreusis TaxID=1969 RepID=UPI0033B6F5DD